MANQLASLPWVIDTVSDTNIFGGYAEIIRIAYTGYAGATDSVEVQDGRGRTVCLLDGNVDLEEIESYFSGWIQGIRIPVLKSAAFGAGPNMPNGRLIIQLQ